MSPPRASDARRGEFRPAGSPALLDPGQADQRNGRKGCKDKKTDLIAAGELPRIAEARCEIEPADPSGHADDAGHYADLPPETLRHELKHRAVAHAERQHCDD